MNECLVEAAEVGESVVLLSTCISARFSHLAAPAFSVSKGSRANGLTRLPPLPRHGLPAAAAAATAADVSLASRCFARFLL